MGLFIYYIFIMSFCELEYYFTIGYLIIHRRLKESSHLKCITICVYLYNHYPFVISFLVYLYWAFLFVLLFVKSQNNFHENSIIWFCFWHFLGNFTVCCLFFYHQQLINTCMSAYLNCKLIYKKIWLKTHFLHLTYTGN